MLVNPAHDAIKNGLGAVRDDRGGQREEPARTTPLKRRVQFPAQAPAFGGVNRYAQIIGPVKKIASRRRLLKKVRYPDRTADRRSAGSCESAHSQYAYDRRRQFVAGDPGIFKPQRRYDFIMTAGHRFFNRQM